MTKIANPEHMELLVGVFAPVPTILLAILLAGLANVPKAGEEVDAIDVCLQKHV